MRCSICGAELKENGVCSECGFDKGLDYECYPTIFPVSADLSLFAKREEWNEKNRDLLLCPNCGGKYFSLRQKEKRLICSACASVVPLEEAVPREQIAADDLSSWEFDISSGTLFIHRQEAMKDYPGKSAPWYSSREQIHMVVVEPGVTAIGERAFAYLTYVTRFLLPDSLRRIGTESFEYCMRLERLALPEGVETIGDRAFQYCERLRELNCPSSLTSAGQDLLRGCIALQNPPFPQMDERMEVPTPPGSAEAGTQEDPSSWEFDVGSGTLFIHRQEAMKDYPGRSAPWYSSRGQIRMVIVESGVTEIGERAFAYLTYVTRFLLPDSLRRVGAEAFGYCMRLERLMIPEGVETIEDGAFQYCERLRELTLPSSLDSPGNNMLRGCIDLRDLFFRGNREQWEKLVSEKDVGIESRAELHCAE